MKTPFLRTTKWPVVRAAILLGLAVQPLVAAARKPNIVVILADDLGYADVGFHGSREIPTPHLDALAKSGVRCTNGYVSGTVCSPTRAGLLTGRYQQRFGHEFNPSPYGAARETAGLPTTETTLADRLQAAGYVTGLVGKWHLGAARHLQPQKRGFDEFFGFLGGSHVYLPGRPNVIFPGRENPTAEPPDGSPRPPNPILRGTEEVEEREYLTDAFAREAVSFIERHRTRPFFLYLAFNAVHTPMHATDDRLAKFTSDSDPMRRAYCAMTLALDEAVGRVIARIRATNLEQDTLIFFCSDNGGPTLVLAAQNGARNDPLRGSKSTPLEGGIRVPFVVSWPGNLPMGAVYTQPVIQLDVLPTALAAAGIAIKPEWKIDGVNLLPHFRGEVTSAPHEMLFWRYGGQGAIRQGPWKMVRYLSLMDGGDSRAPTPARLYHLDRDIGEAHDLAGTEPQVLRELQALWDSWNATLATPGWAQPIWVQPRPVNPSALAPWR